MTAKKIVKGTLFYDSFGQLYIDTCKTSDEHMLKPLLPGQERRQCRVYLEEIVQEMIGQTGEFEISVSLEKKEI